MADFSPHRVVLDNGLTVLHQENAASPAVVAALYVAAGACFEAPAAAGLATLTAGALRRGTATRSKTEIGEVLDFRGAHLRCSAGRHSASIVTKMRAVDTPALLELTADCARNPSFPADELEKLRGNRLTSLREDLDDPDAVAGDSFREMMYPEGHPYRAPIRGDLTTVETIQTADLRAFHARQYHAASAMLVIVGAISQDEALALVREHFGDWESGAAAGYRQAQVEIPDVPLLPVDDSRSDMPDKAQLSLLMGHAGIRRTDARYYAAILMNAVLGRFAMGGRLGKSVREEQGMAYYTYSGFGAGLGPGPFAVRAGVQPQHLEAAIDSIRTQVGRMRDEGVTEAELDDVRSAAIRSLPQALESNEGIAGLLHEIEMFDLGLDFPTRYPGVLEGVDVGAANAAAGELLHPDHLSVSVAGPLAPANA